MDWGEGQYERTARTLEDVARRVIDAASITAGTRVLDLGCGTGNAALEAARRGGDVVAVDPAKRLLDVCGERARQAGLALVTKQGHAGAIPADDGSVDVLVSNFAVIFAPDADEAASEILRVLRPGGRAVLTSWVPTGAIASAGKILREAILLVDPAAGERKSAAWGDPAFLHTLFESRGAAVTIEEAATSFESTSPAAWFEEQEEHHPVWRTIRLAMAAHPGEWDRVRARSIEALAAENEDAASFRVTSPYLLVTVTRGHS